MKNKCIDIGNLQGFIDGELTNKHAEGVVGHLSVCEICRLALEDLESEGELVFAALESEYNVLVPTERLRAKVFASINQFESGGRPGFLSRLAAGFGILSLRPGFATVAGVLLFAALFTIGFRFLNGVEQDGLPSVAVRDAGLPDAGVDNERIDSPGTGLEDNGSVAVALPAPEEQQAVPDKINTGSQASGSTLAVYRTDRGRVPRAPVRPNNTNSISSEPLQSVNLDAEEGYLKTIATLSRTVNENKDYVMRPSERVTYERNLAVVDDAIKKMKGEVRTNPNNTAAREVLRSSYKNKIDLLNSVAGRTETVASLY